MAPLVIALIVVGTFMIVGHRQDTANARHKHEALQQTAKLADSFEAALLNAMRDGAPDENRTRELAKQNHGTLITRTTSGRSLTTVVDFFTTYESVSFFGTSETQASRCYSFRLETGGRSGVRRTVLPPQGCNRT
ncbi:hypothetical protein ACIBI8_39630 [Streptomyces sp. NPDC050529]|uniref:hypothetical protein n=1 Tax=unclassified Streptomyces TaxID=2593676 RepID=UPI002DD89001|nr:hypothetical protein [Streptomyces sp. NBC_01022]WRZ79757.1 hypothetical protein OG316_05540 [Streptomyces sp. NBC_01022]